MTADQLAAAVTDLGMRYTRSQVTNLEGGRRDGITIGELIAFGQVLNIPPIILVFPVGHADKVELRPDSMIETWEALRWFTGEPPQSHSQGKADPWLTATEPLREHRRHQRLLDDLLRHERRKYAAVSVQFTPDQPPPTPEDCAEAERRIDAEERVIRGIEDDLRELRQQMRLRGYEMPPVPGRQYLDEDGAL